MYIILDFDGVVVANNYPEIGAANPCAIRVLQLLQKQNDIILNSARIEADNGTIDEAVEYLTKNDIFLHMVLSERIMPYEWRPDHFIKTGNFYIDDMSFGIPLIRCHNGNRRWMVDWTKIELILRMKNIIS